MLIGDWWLGESQADCRSGLEAFIEGRDEESGGGILTGSGNRGPLFFFRLGSRKNVVVVETVCVVVVVVAYTPWSALPSEREDSDSLLIGRAIVE